MHGRLNGLAIVFALAVAAAAGSSAQAQTYPSRSITFIVPNTPGGASDLIARAVAAKLQDSFGRAVVVENKPGASEMIGAEVLANTPPDGYTIAILSNAMAINETLSPNRRYEVLRDFTPVARLAELPFALMVRSALPVTSLKELVELAKAQPGQLSYAHVGVGAPQYLTMEWFKRAAGIDIVPVPYRSSPPAFTGLLGGEVQLTVTSLGGATQFIQTGQVRALAAMSSRRPISLPNLPTVAEFGYPEFDLVPWMGVFLRSGTPAEIVHKLEAELIKAVTSPEVSGQLNKVGLEAAPLTSSEFTSLIRRDIANWASVIQDVGVKTP